MSDRSTEEIRADFDRLALLEGRDPDRNALYHPYLLRRLPRRLDAALDVGCGTGSFTRLLSARARSVLGIDLSPEMIRLARKRSGNHPNVEYRVADATEWDLPRSSLDCIASIAALHHLPAERCLPRFADALRPGGVLLILDLVDTAGPWGPVWSGAAAAASAGWRLARHGRVRPDPEYRAAWSEHGKGDRYPRLEEVRASARRYLPGAAVRALLFWRYSLVWTKPPAPNGQMISR